MTSKKDARKTRLRQRMIDQMRIAGLARNTQASYVREIKCLAKAFNMSPDRLEPEQVRSWHLARIDRGLSENTTNVGLAALKFFYRDTLHQPRMIDGLRMRKVPRGLPRAMSEEEIERLLMATPDLRYRTSMTLTYACGLRISEIVAITIDDVKSKDGLLHIRSGKGATERMAPLPDGMVDHLKDYWRKTYPKPVSWLFYGRSPEHAIKQDTLRQAFNRARDLAAIASHHTFHGLRHSAATHMFEAGGSIDVIQDAMGHRSADTDAQLCPSHQRHVQGPQPSDLEVVPAEPLIMAVRIDVAEIFRHVAPGYRKRCAGHLSAAQLKAMSAIEVCRTPVLGGHMWHCDGCGHDHPLYNSCHNRHCPTCQGLAALKWSETREHDILPVPYFHIVFTLPREIAQIAFANRKVVFDILFRTTASTLRTIAADPRRGGLHTGGTAVLHTWNQQMLFHPHLHVVIPNAGFDVTTGEWRTGSATFFAPVKVLASLFRRLFLVELEKAHNRGQLVFHGTTARLAEPTAFRDTIREARSKDWVVYAKPPFRGPQQVFRYLSRYTHRIAISNSRILAFDGGSVTFRCRKPGNSDKPHYGTVTVSADEFIRRFLLHVVPDGMHRIRYFGILANACRTRNLDIARKAMNAPDDTDDDGDVRKDDPGIAPVPCPHCGATMVIVGILTAARSRHASRGPPETP